MAAADLTDDDVMRGAGCARHPPEPLRGDGPYVPAQPRGPAENDGLGIHLRSPTGLDREAAGAALDRFQRGRNVTANQLHFLAMLTDVLAKNGIVDVGQLHEAPFTALASGGSEDLFPEAAVDAIVTVLRDVRMTAVPRAEAI